MRKSSQWHPPTVFVAIPTAGKDGQQRLEGVLRYLRLGYASWNLKLVTSLATVPVEEVERLADSGTDAFLLHLPFDRKDAERLKRLGKPIVLTTAFEKKPSSSVNTFRYLLLDNHQLGTMAAMHLMSLGRFASYGYVPSAYTSNWSYERGKSFSAQLRQHGFSCVNFAGTQNANMRTHEHGELVRWIRSLRLPAAIFAANDNYAMQTLMACEETGLNVPAQVAILGVDNDELIAANFSPSLSSIEPDFIANGFNAARELNRMLFRTLPKRTGTIQGQRLCSSNPRLVIRESTAFLSPATKLVENAMARIDKLALSGATPASIANQLGVSRCLLDLRMRQSRKETLGSLLRKRRLEEVRKLLKTTCLPIGAIAGRCGFQNVNALRNLFRRTYGIPMRDWRKSLPTP